MKTLKSVVSRFITVTLLFVSSSVLSNPWETGTGLTNEKINSAKNQFNTYQTNKNLPEVSAYLSNWTHYSQGLVPSIETLSAYDKVILSFFGACGTQVGDPSITASVKKIEENCNEHGGDKFQIMSTDLYADFQKAFPAAGVNGVWDASWKSLNYGGLMGVLKKLSETTDTEVGVSIFGWSLSNIVSDAVKPENRQVLVTSLVRFINAYPFITQIDIDWEYPGVRGAANNVFDPQNDARNYAAFIKLLRQELNNNGRNRVKLAIAAGAPKNIIDAANLKSLCGLWCGYYSLDDL